MVQPTNHEEVSEENILGGDSRKRKREQLEEFQDKVRALKTNSENDVEELRDSVERHTHIVKKCAEDLKDSWEKTEDHYSRSLEAVSPYPELLEKLENERKLIEKSIQAIGTNIKRCSKEKRVFDKRISDVLKKIEDLDRIGQGLQNRRTQYEDGILKELKRFYMNPAFHRAAANNQGGGGSMYLYPVEKRIHPSHDSIFS